MSLETQITTPSTLPPATTIATEIVSGEHRQIVVIALPQTPITRAATRSRPTTAGTISAGCRCITVVNIGVASGWLAGQPLEAGASFAFDILALGEVYAAVAYDATGTTFDILEVR
jgi:hypothetical protein